MYRPPPSTTPTAPTDVHNWVSQKKEAFRQAYGLVRRNATTQQRRRNNLYNKRVHGPTCKKNEYVLHHYPVVPVGNRPKLSSPWRGPYEILKCLNDVNYRIRELTTGKVQVVHYDRIKRYHGPIPVASNVQARQNTHPTGYHTSPVPDFDHSQCGKTFLPHLFVPKWRHLAQVTTQLHDCHLQILLLITSQIAPLQSLRLVFFIPRADVVYLHRQGLLITNAIRHRPFQWSPVPVQLLENFSRPNHLLRKQLLFSLPLGLNLSSMVLLPIFVSDSIVHHSRTVLQHIAPLWTNHLTYTLLLPLIFRPHPDLYVVVPNSNVKCNHYSKPGFLETSQKFRLLRRSQAPTGNCKITNIFWAPLLF